ncbi:NAD(P)/FAD-dependent oxidoreductase [Sphingobacterium suaedae]|uniref:NAD(P)/FAD-dependent oxidoreductase n=1 Tax=Sphingobacterium suaedae TaxID=1686402 RepID=A0ABW5KF50_9SPHI
MKTYDVIIIGGSYAGLAAALALGRLEQHTLIIDDERPCNRYAREAHNVLAHDGDIPATLIGTAKSQLATYPTIYYLNDRVQTATPASEGLIVKTVRKKAFRTKKLVLATGIVDQLPETPGFIDCWGKSVLDCPYCHGYAYRKQKTVVLAEGKEAVRLLSLVRNLTEDITVVAPDHRSFSSAQRNKLKRKGVNIIEKHIESFAHTNGQVSRILFRDQSSIAANVVYATLPFAFPDNLPEQLGCQLTKQGYIKVNKFQQTTVPHVYACGDNSNFLRSITSAIYAGHKTGMSINKELSILAF